MKILIASGTFPPQLGGMATFVKNFSDTASAHGHQVAVVSYGERDGISDFGYDVHLVSRARSLFARYYKYFQKLYALAPQYDLIFAQDLISSGIPAAAASMFSGRKMVLRLGGDFLWEKMVQKGKCQLPIEEYYKSAKSLGERIYLAFYHSVLSRAEKVVFNSELQASIYKRFFKITQDKLFVVENAVEGVRSKTHMPVQDRKNIVYAGRFIKLKNLPLFLEAVPNVPSEHKIVLFGEGPDEQELKSLVKSRGLEQRVEIRSSLDRQALAEYFAKSYLVVIPSLTEFNPHTALEALHVGTPVLLTENNGLAFEVKNKLEQFDPTSLEDLTKELKKLFDPKEYESYLRKIQNLEFHKSWQEVYDEYERILKSIK